jgi:hypothetical protein
MLYFDPSNGNVMLYFDSSNGNVMLYLTQVMVM